MKKFKALDWSDDSGLQHSTVMLLDGDWEFVVCFYDHDNWCWNLNTDNTDPSELIMTGNSLQQLKDWAQKEHEASILSKFFEE